MQYTHKHILHIAPTLTSTIRLLPAVIVYCRLSHRVFPPLSVLFTCFLSCLSLVSCIFISVVLYCSSLPFSLRPSASLLLSEPLSVIRLTHSVCAIVHYYKRKTDMRNGKWRKNNEKKITSKKKRIPIVSTPSFLHTFCCLPLTFVSFQTLKIVSVCTCSLWKMSRRCSSPRLFKNWLMVMSSRAAKTQ